MNHRYQAQDRLPDGRRVLVRSVNADDKELLQELVQGLSPESRYFRFFGAKKALTEKELTYFTEIDFQKHIALLVFLDDGSQALLAVGRYIVSNRGFDPQSAEVSLLVHEDHHRSGIGTLLSAHLVSLAEKLGVTELHFNILSENYKMLKFLQRPSFAELGEVRISRDQAGMAVATLSLS